MRLNRIRRGGPAEDQPVLLSPVADSPASYLRAEARLVPYWPTAALDALLGWLTSDGALATQLVVGPAGAGKTRLALELADQAIAQGWQCSWPTVGRQLDAAALVESGTGPVLVVVDDAESHAGLPQFLGQVIGDGTRPRLRILLLARQEGEWWRRVLALRDRRTGNLLDRRELIAIGPLCSPQDSGRAFQQAVTAFARRLNASRPSVQLPPGLAGETPLVVHGQALIAVLDLTSEAGKRAAEGDINRARVISWLLGHETRYWQHRLAEAGLDLDEKLTGQLVAAATLIGADDDAEASRLLTAFAGLSDPAQRGDVATWLHYLYPADDPGPGHSEWLGPFRPELLAENLIARVLNYSELVPALVAALPDDRITRALTILAQAGLTYQGTAAETAAIMVLRAAIAADPVRLAVPALQVAVQVNPAVGELLADLLSERQWPLDLLERMAARLPESSLILARAAAAVLRQLADATAGDVREHGRYLILLSNQLNDLGRREDTLAALDEAIVGYRRVPPEQHDDFRPDLATALNNRSAPLGALGRRQDSLVAVDEAAAIFRELVTEQPEKFGPGLASALNNRATRLAELGQRAEALATADLAVATYREVAASNDDLDRAGLARALHNQSRSRFDLGHREEALAAIDETLVIYRQLAGTNPDAYRPSLASSLNNQSSYLASLGRVDEAVAAIDEASGLYRALAAIHPAAYRASLAGSLSTRSVFLIDLGQASQARLAVDEAVRIYRDLVSEEPDAFTADYAGALNNQARALASLGQHSEALMMIGLSIKYYRQLADEQPDLFLPDLAMAYSNQSVCQALLGYVSPALHSAHEAAIIYTRLAAEQPDAFLPDMAMIRNNQAQYLTHLGQAEQALTAITEAVDIRRQLAEARPAAFASDLYVSLNVKAQILIGLGREPEASQLQAEAGRLGTE